MNLCCRIDIEREWTRVYRAEIELPYSDFVHRSRSQHRSIERSDTRLEKVNPDYSVGRWIERKTVSMSVFNPSRQQSPVRQATMASKWTSDARERAAEGSSSTDIR